MINIEIDPNKPGKVVYDSKATVFHASEKDLKFDTTYRIRNTNSGKHRDFHFVHSTGPEFDPNTTYVYKENDNGLELHVHNDPEVTKKAAAAYLEAKTQKS
jgi:hypothetical protein